MYLDIANKVRIRSQIYLETVCQGSRLHCLQGRDLYMVVENNAEGCALSLLHIFWVV